MTFFPCYFAKQDTTEEQSSAKKAEARLPESGFRRAEGPTAIREEMLRRHPELQEGIRWKLERCIRSWRAVYGKEEDANFLQAHEPCGLGLSDFVEMGRLGVTIAGGPLEQLLYDYQFVRSASSIPMPLSAARAL